MLNLPYERDHFRRLITFEQTQSRRFGRDRMTRYYLNRRYYYGDSDDPDNIKQPLGIRYIPTINQKHTHYLFGEWERDIVGWSVVPWDSRGGDDPIFEEAAKLQRALYRIMRRAQANDVLYKGALDGSIYGDTVFKVRWDPQIDGAKLEAVLPEYYHAMWYPLDPQTETEVVIAFNMDRVMANSIYGTPGDGQYVPESGSVLGMHLAIVWEYWSHYHEMIAVDNEIVRDEPNTFSRMKDGRQQPGLIPFVHIANLATNGEYYGVGDAEQIFALADEINYRLADMGDVINYHAHPITILTGWYGDTEKLPTAPDAVWDLGREGKAEYLNWSGPSPEIMAYIDMLLRVMMETTALTPISFGKIDSSQASSAALNIQMLPITEVVRRKRATWGPQLRKLALMMLEIEARILGSAGFRSRYDFDFSTVDKFDIQPKWAAILPRDQAALVNEQIGLLAGRARSIIQALNELGIDDPELERARIVQDFEEFTELAAKIQAKYQVQVETAPGGKNNDKHTGGSNTDGGSV